MKILMFHNRAAGHNILPFLEFFENDTKNALTFLYVEDIDPSFLQSNINFVKFNFSPIQLYRIFKILQKDVDLYWYHGGHSAIHFFLFSLMRKKKTTFIFNIWNEWLIRKAQTNSLKGTLFRWAIKSADVVHCNWHGTAEILKSIGWAKRIKVFYWGLHKSHFIQHQEIERQETKDFIDSLPADKKLFFFPKSISPNSRHDLVIEAAAILRAKNYASFRIYFWEGNTNNAMLKSDYEKQIRQLNLSDHVIIQKHGFLPFSDMQCIWQKMDVGLQIAANEQLSTTFLEPQFYGKEILVTNIRPYQIYNEVFDLKIPLLPLEPKPLADAMKKIIDGHYSNKESLKQRQEIVKENFNFSENIKHIVSDYQKEILV